MYIARGTGVVSLLSWLAATLIYYLPGIPTSPRPETGNLFAVRNHYTILYWNSKEEWAFLILTYTAILFFGITFYIGSRIGAFDRKK